MNQRKSNNKSKSDYKDFLIKFAILACFTAIVIIFQFLGGFIKIGSATSVSLVLVPIVIGSVMLGPLEGAYLGFVFGIIVLCNGIVGNDGFTHILWQNQPVATSILCILKGVLAGLGSGLVYKACNKITVKISEKNKKRQSKGEKVWIKISDIFAVLCAAMTAPLLNTSIFILGGLFMVDQTLVNNFVSGTTLIYYLVIGCAGVNFIAEFILNIVLSPAIKTITDAGKKIIFKK